MRASAEKKLRESGNSRADFFKNKLLLFFPFAPGVRVSSVSADSSCACVHALDVGSFCSLASLAGGTSALGGTRQRCYFSIKCRIAGTHSVCTQFFLLPSPSLDWNLTSFKETGNIFGSFVWQQQQRLAFTNVYSLWFTHTRTHPVKDAKAAARDGGGKSRRGRRKLMEFFPSRSPFSCFGSVLCVDWMQALLA